MREKPIAVTTGEPAGIGPEVALKAAVAADYPIVLLGDRALLDATRKKLGLPTLPTSPLKTCRFRCRPCRGSSTSATAPTS